MQQCSLAFHHSSSQHVTNQAVQLTVPAAKYRKQHASHTILGVEPTRGGRGSIILKWLRDWLARDLQSLLLCMLSCKRASGSRLNHLEAHVALLSRLHCVNECTPSKLVCYDSLHTCEL